MMNLSRITGGIFSVYLCLIAISVHAQPGDELIVQGGIVNLRKGPSIDYDVVSKLENGDKLYEISRDGKWVQVQTEPGAGTSGWIHSSLVRPGGITQTSTTPDREERLKKAFDRFRPAFDTLNARIELETGAVPFINADYTGNGAIKVTAAESWLNLSRIQRERNLSEIFKLWDDVVEVGLPVSVDIVNANDERLMVMFR